MLTIFDLLLSAQLAMVAYTISVVLTSQDMILEKYLDWLIALNKKLPMLAKPLGYCDKCFAGQVALWVWFILHYEKYLSTLVESTCRHISFICLTILLSITIKAIFKKWK